MSESALPIGSIATRPVLPKAGTSLTHPTQSFRVRANAEIYLARSCYDHLAGRVAVALTHALEERKVLRAFGEREYVLGRAGSGWFAELGVDVDVVRNSRRSFARRCLDWTERRPHLAGALGASLFPRLLALGWIVQRHESRRITHLGEREFWRRFAIKGS